MGTCPNEVERNMQLEHIIQNKVMVELSQAGFTPYRMVVGTYYTKILNPIKVGIEGTPDLLVLKNDGQVFWVEMKTEKKGSRLRKVQEDYHTFLKSINHRVYVVRSVEDIEKVIAIEKEKESICHL